MSRLRKVTLGSVHEALGVRRSRRLAAKLGEPARRSLRTAAPENSSAPAGRSGLSPRSLPASIALAGAGFRACDALIQMRPRWRGVSRCH